jgi:hypothetical protein
MCCCVKTKKNKLLKFLKLICYFCFHNRTSAKVEPLTRRAALQCGARRLLLGLLACLAECVAVFYCFVFFGFGFCCLMWIVVRRTIRTMYRNRCHRHNKQRWQSNHCITSTIIDISFKQTNKRDHNNNNNNNNQTTKQTNNQTNNSLALFLEWQRVICSEAIDVVLVDDSAKRSLLADDLTAPDVVRIDYAWRNVMLVEVGVGGGVCLCRLTTTTFIIFNICHHRHRHHHYYHATIIIMQQQQPPANRRCGMRSTIPRAMERAAIGVERRHTSRQSLRSRTAERSRGIARRPGVEGCVVVETSERERERESSRDVFVVFRCRVVGADAFAAVVLA